MIAVIGTFPPGFYQFLIFGNDQIIAALAIDGGANGIVDFLASIQTENAVVHFPIDKINFIVIQQHAIGSDGETEIFTVFLFLRTGIRHNFLHSVKIHGGFPAKEVQLQIFPAVGVFQQVVNGFFPHFCTHQCPLSPVFSGGSKAVFAAQITVMGNVQAHGLHRARHHLGSVIPIRILAEELIHLHQFPHILVGFGDLLHGVLVLEFFHQFPFAVIGNGEIQNVQQIAGHIVHYMDSPAIDV